MTMSEEDAAPEQQSSYIAFVSKPAGLERCAFEIAQRMIGPAEHNKRSTPGTTVNCCHAALYQPPPRTLTVKSTTQRLRRLEENVSVKITPGRRQHAQQPGIEALDEIQRRAIEALHLRGAAIAFCELLVAAVCQRRLAPMLLRTQTRR